MPTPPPDTIHIYCPLCGGGPQELAAGRPVACVDCHVELMVVWLRWGMMVMTVSEENTSK